MRKRRARLAIRRRRETAPPRRGLSRRRLDCSPVTAGDQKDARTWTWDRRQARAAPTARTKRTWRRHQSTTSPERVPAAMVGCRPAARLRRVLFFLLPSHQSEMDATCGPGSNKAVETSRGEQLEPHHPAERAANDQVINGFCFLITKGATRMVLQRLTMSSAWLVFYLPIFPPQLHWTFHFSFILFFVVIQGSQQTQGRNKLKKQAKSPSQWSANHQFTYMNSTPKLGSKRFTSIQFRIQ